MGRSAHCQAKARGSNESAEERCDGEHVKVVRLAGIEPTTLGFGGSDFPLDCCVRQSGFPMVLWGNCGASEWVQENTQINSTTRPVIPFRIHQVSQTSWTTISRARKQCTHQ